MQSIAGKGLFRDPRRLRSARVLAVPDGSSRRVTFTAPPGRYDFHDEITLGNMRGVLVVR